MLPLPPRERRYWENALGKSYKFFYGQFLQLFVRYLLLQLLFSNRSGLVVFSPGKQERQNDMETCLLP